MTNADREKLVAILGMLGSDHAGERAAAGLAATNLLHKLELTWSDVIPEPRAVHVPVQPSHYTPAERAAQAAYNAWAANVAQSSYQSPYQQAYSSYQAQMNAYQANAPADWFNSNPFNPDFGKGL